MSKEVENATENDDVEKDVDPTPEAEDAEAGTEPAESESESESGDDVETDTADEGEGESSETDTDAADSEPGDGDDTTGEDADAEGEPEEEIDPEQLALRLQSSVEALIFVSSEPLTLKRLAKLFPDETTETLEAAVQAVEERHAAPGGGLRLDRVAGGLRLVTRPEVEPHVTRFVQQEKAERLSLRTLETLSVIAYKQPVTAAEIQEIRGVDPGGTVRTLLDKNLVKVAGRKKVVGRPFVYATTSQFLKTFGLNDLSELPSLRELEEFASELPTTDPTQVEPENDTIEDAGAELVEELAEEGEAESDAAGEETELGSDIDEDDIVDETADDEADPE